MVAFRRYHALSFALLLALQVSVAAAGEAGLHDQPVLTLDPGMHTAAIRRADVSATGAYAVTGSHDKTVRIWAVATGRLLRTIRLPQGPGHVGKVYAVAISPDGALVAAGGYTRETEAGPPEQIYLFDRDTGEPIRRLEGLPNGVTYLAFSPTGRYLAATLWDTHGLRVYDRDADWHEVARDAPYGGTSYGAAFAADGRLATTSLDGMVRLSVAIKATALSALTLRQELAGLAQRGRVLVLLDACRSGGAMANGEALAADAAQLRMGLKGATIAVLTSSSAAELSREDPRWGNGAFTEILLEALSGRADANRNGMISISELTSYLRHHVPGLTHGAQQPELAALFDSDVFVAGL